MVVNAYAGLRTARFLRAAGVAIAIVVAIAVAVLCCAFFPFPIQTRVALAEDIDTNPAADEFQLKIEQTATAYSEAVAAADEAGKSLGENESRVADLERQIPEQQARSAAAVKELYKFEQQRLGFLDLMLGSDSFFELLTYFDYANRVTENNLAEMRRLSELKVELDSERAMLEQAKAEADARAADAQRALTEAQQARLEAQRKAAEAVRQAAEADAAAHAGSATAAASSASTAAASSAPSASTAADSTDSANSGGESSQSSDTTSVADAASEAVAAVNDTADWTSDEAAFVNSWAARIDAYLAGSPLSGQGATFAQAAWNYGVDPRWSPAIAYTESSLGAYCFLPHNAWGWGSVSWGSWEEAIDAHVRGLARGYGYTISLEAAYKYCPPNAEHWYNVTLAQMNQI